MGRGRGGRRGKLQSGLLPPTPPLQVDYQYPKPYPHLPSPLQVDYWVAPEFGERFFNSCKDVKFGAANLPAMSFIGGGATTFQV